MNPICMVLIRQTIRGRRAPNEYIMGEDTHDLENVISAVADPCRDTPMGISELLVMMYLPLLCIFLILDVQSLEACVNTENSGEP